MALFLNKRNEGDIFDRVRRYINSLGYYSKPQGGIPASDLAKWVLPSAVTDSAVGELGYTKNEGTVTAAKMNGGNAVWPDDDGVVDLGNVVTDVSGKADKSAAIGSLSLSLDNTNFKITLSGAKCDGTTFTVSNVIDLPLESVVVNGSYDNNTKKVILTLQNGSTIEFSVVDLVSGLQSEITASNMLSADLVDDSSATNKFVTASDKSTWNGKQDALVFNTAYDATTNKAATMADVPSTSNFVQKSNTVGLLKNDGTIDTTAYTTNTGTITSVKMNGSTVSSSGEADLGTVITEHQDISGKENTSNKVTSLSSSSTDTQYPSAKCVWDLVGDIETILASI